MAKEKHSIDIKGHTIQYQLLLNQYVSILRILPEDRFDEAHRAMFCAKTRQGPA